MATELILQKNEEGRLVPVDGMSEEAIDSLPAGKPLGVTVKQKRNLKHHNKYWALMSAVWPHQGLYATVRGMSKGVLKAIGHTEEVLDPVTLEYSEDAASIAFDKLDQDEFERVYERAVQVIMIRILPGVGREDLERQVSDILNGRAAA